jgi:WD40 repeat protein
VWLWNITSPGHPARIGHPLTGPGNIVYAVAFSPDGRTLAAGSDQKVWLWNITSPGHPVPIGQPLTGPGQFVISVAFSPDGRTLAASSNDQNVWLWNLDLTQVITRICTTTSGNLTPAQWIRNIPQLPYNPPCHKK